MSEKKKHIENKTALVAGYQPIEKGYKPLYGKLDSSNPPHGGSGVPSEIHDKKKKNIK